MSKIVLGQNILDLVFTSEENMVENSSSAGEPFGTSGPSDCAMGIKASKG